MKNKSQQQAEFVVRELEEDWKLHAQLKEDIKDLVLYVLRNLQTQIEIVEARNQELESDLVEQRKNYQRLLEFND